MKKYLTREEKLKNSLVDELTRPVANNSIMDRANNIIKIINEYETANIDSIAKLRRVKQSDDNKIRGALKQAIHAHGPITKELIGSALKRINGAIMLNEGEIPVKKNILGFIPFSIRDILIGVGISSCIWGLIWILL